MRDRGRFATAARGTCGSEGPSRSTEPRGGAHATAYVHRRDRRRPHRGGDVRVQQRWRERRFGRLRHRGRHRRRGLGHPHGDGRRAPGRELDGALPRPGRQPRAPGRPRLDDRPPPLQHAVRRAEARRRRLRRARRRHTDRAGVRPRPRRAGGDTQRRPLLRRLVLRGRPPRRRRVEAEQDPGLGERGRRRRRRQADRRLPRAGRQGRHRPGGVLSHRRHLRSDAGRRARSRVPGVRTDLRQPHRGDADHRRTASS